MLLVCASAGPPTWHYVRHSWCVLPWQGLPLLRWAVPSCLQSLLWMVEDSRYFPDWSIPLCMLTATILVSWCLDSYVGRTLYIYYGLELWTRMNEIIRQQISGSPGSVTPPHASSMVTEPEVWKNFIEASLGIGVHISTFRLTMVFCSGLHQLQRVVFWMRSEDWTHLWVWEQMFCN